MEDRKLLNAQVFNGWQKLLNLSLKTLFFRGFFIVLFLFTLFLYILGAKKHTLLNKFLSQKDCQFDRKKKMEVMREERE